MFTLELPEQEWPPLLLFPLSKPQQFAPCFLLTTTNHRVLFAIATCKPIPGGYQDLQPAIIPLPFLCFLLLQIASLFYSTFWKLQEFANCRVLFAISTCRPILGSYQDLQITIIPLPCLFFLLLQIASLFYSTFWHLQAFANYSELQAFSGSF